MTNLELREYADDCEAQAMVMIEHLHGGFNRVMTSEAADLFTIAAAIRVRLGEAS